VEPGLLPALAVALTGLAAAGSMLMVTALLASEGGRSSALGYLGGYLGAYTAIGLAVVAGDVDAGAWTSGDAGRAGPIVMVALGLLLMAAGARAALRPRPETGTKGAGPTTGLLDRATPARAFGLGVAVAFVNVKNLALYLTAIAVLQASDLTATRKLAAAPLVALTFSLAVFVPLAIDVAAPARSGRALAALRRGIERHGRRFGAWLPLGVGLVFVVRGARGLA
jgi:hypothetical protein